MQPTEFQKVFLRNPTPVFIDFGLLGEYHHKINLIAGGSLLLNVNVVPLLWTTSYIALLSK